MNANLPSSRVVANDAQRLLQRTSCIVAVLVSATACGLYNDHSLAINVHVDAVTPAVVPSTGSASVVIRGQNFDPGVAVSIGGIPARAVERVDAETLVVAVPAHAIGAVDVVVSNVDGRTATATAALAYYAGALQFANHTQLVAATGHRLPLLGADFDGDGNGDMALYDLNNRLRIYAGDRAGRMVARDERSVDATTPLAAADLNRDGRDDIVAEKGVILMEAGGTLGALLPWPNAEYATHVVVLPDGAKPHMLLVEANRLSVVELQGSSLTTIATYTDAEHTVRCGSVFEPCLPAVNDFDLDGNSDLAFVDINGRARLAFGPTLGETVDLQLSPRAWGQPLALVAPAYGAPVVDLMVAGSMSTWLLSPSSGVRTTAPTVLPALCGAESPRAVWPILGAARSMHTENQVAVQCGAYVQLLELQAQTFTPKWQAVAAALRRPQFIDINADGHVDVIETRADDMAVNFGSYDRLLRVGSYNTTGSSSALLVAGQFQTGRAVTLNDDGEVVALGSDGRSAFVGRIDFAGRQLDDAVACDLDGDNVDDLLVSLRTNFGEQRLYPLRLGREPIVLGDALTPADGAWHRLLVAAHADRRCEAWWLTSNEYGGVVQWPATRWTFGAAGPVQASIALAEPTGAIPNAALSAVKGNTTALVDLEGDDQFELYAVDNGLAGVGARAAVLRVGAGGLTVAVPELPAELLDYSALFTPQALQVVRDRDGTNTLWTINISGSNSGGAPLLHVVTLDQAGNAKAVSRHSLANVIFNRGFALSFGEFDGDGKQDAVLLGSSTGAVVVTRPQGTVRVDTLPDFSDQSGGALEDWRTVTVFDHNGDGLDDLWFTSYEYGAIIGGIANTSK